MNGERYLLTNAPNLRMERSHSVNASANLCLHFGDLEAELLVEGFYTRINDAFVNELLFDDTVSGYMHYERRNADGAEVKGVNVEMTVSPMETMRIQLGTTWQRSLYTGRGKEWDEGQYERRMERTPDLYAYISDIYKPIKRLTLIATGTFTGPMLVYHNVADETKHGDGGEVEKVITSSFLDLSLKAAYSIPFGSHASLEISIGIQNLLDSYQRDLDSGPERDAGYVYGPSLPRTVFFGAKLAL